MSRLPPLMRRTFTPRVIEWKDGFAGLFRLDDQIGLLSRTYRDPVLVASTDGVGTKLKLAFATGRHDTVGIDLVAMSVNDCLCAGAEPLLFLDYVAMNRDDPELTAAGRQGDQRRLHRGRVRPPGRRDGDPARLLPAGRVRPGRLLRRRRRAQAHPRRPRHPRRRQGDRPGQLGPALQRLQPGAQDRLRPRRARRPRRSSTELGRTVADEFLEPTRIYVRAVKTVYRHYRVKRIVHGIAHITGGGLIDNPPRILPEGCAIRLRRGSWPVPPVFPWLQTLGDVDPAEMDRVFNMGIGLVADRRRILRRRHRPPPHPARERSRLDHRRGRRRRRKVAVGLNRAYLRTATSAASGTANSSRVPCLRGLILVISSVIINLLIPIIGRVDKVGKPGRPGRSHRIRRAS